MKDYSALIDLKPPVLKDRMKMSDRAAQFSPFAALTGFEEEIDKSEKAWEFGEYNEDRL